MQRRYVTKARRDMIEAAKESYAAKVRREFRNARGAQHGQASPLPSTGTEETDVGAAAVASGSAGSPGDARDGNTPRSASSNK